METYLDEKSSHFLLDASLLYKDKCPELSRFYLQGPLKAKAPPKQKRSSVSLNTLVCSYCCQWLQPDNHHVRLRPKRRPSARVQSILLRWGRGKRLSLVQKNLLHRFQKSPSVLSIGQSSFEPHPYAQMGGSVAWPGLYKAGHAGSCSKHSSKASVKTERDSELDSAGSLKPNSPTLGSRRLSESEMATFVTMATCHTCSKTSRYKGMNRDFIATFAKTHGTPGSAGKHKTPQSTSKSNINTPKTPGKGRTPAHTPRSSTSSSSTSGSGSTSSKPPKPKNWVVQRLSKILLREDNRGSSKGSLKDFLSSL